MKSASVLSSFLALSIIFFCAPSSAQKAYKDLIFKAGDKSLQEFMLAEKPPFPQGNYPTPARIELGKTLFFDARISGDGNMSCATCHNPVYGWSDALPTAKGSKSMILKRASPTVMNTGYNPIQMWDGRKKTLEDQAMGPMAAAEEMNVDIPVLIKWLNKNQGYIKLFKAAYPGEKIDEKTVSKAIASYERTLISRNSRFDHWLTGDQNALNQQEILGFKIFVNPDKGNCSVCHSEGNFTDNGFHNVGLKSFGDKNPDMGRYTQRPLNLMKGAFKTPTIRDIEFTAPYFHDGSAVSLMDVVNHYVTGGIVKTNVSPNMKKIKLSKKEKEALVAFLKSLSGDHQPITLPLLPL
ncbi:MAG: tryptophan tryptophylquinone biosynthesis enzyme MauG [Pseudomonadales bacterium]|nr:tryptophan tryptophylquinone biosynthesis enzyme MauG [Pseudomonadales bacterium]